ncbi:hypothetical protein VKT23_018562 [Stygiomarasmius scandens]|uniref:Uncharacterized protein n=1 Tax=Marasmiellus scandens TaxID=2682957 RepID=A0ABR1INR0_9AGAR
MSTPMTIENTIIIVTLILSPPLTLKTETTITLSPEEILLVPPPISYDSRLTHTSVTEEPSHIPSSTDHHEENSDTSEQDEDDNKNFLKDSAATEELINSIYVLSQRAVVEWVTVGGDLRATSLV